uniref:Uncharacterized protein n=1 Tax=Sus scrofa TaxID=9823 RepID=A0A4X1UJK6_PIG
MNNAPGIQFWGSIYPEVILLDHMVTLYTPRRRKCEQRKKNLKSLMMTWTLVFLTKSLL